MLLKQLSEKYGENTYTLTRYCQSGELKAEKIKNRWNVKVRDYKKWKKNREKAKAAEKEKINTSQCRRCRYGIQLASAVFCCNYLEETGHMRNCPTYPRCRKFEQKKGKHS